MGFLGEFSFFSAGGQPILPIQTYLILNVIFLMIAILFNGQTLLNGLKGLFFLRANTDSGVAIAALVAEVHALVLAFVPERVTDASLHLYVLLAALALLLNTAGKLVQVRRVGRNFRFVSSPDAKMSVQIFDDHNTALRMGRDCVPGVPVIAYQKKARFLRNFMRLSFEFDPSDQNSQLIAPLGGHCLSGTVHRSLFPLRRRAGGADSPDGFMLHLCALHQYPQRQPAVEGPG